MHSWAVAHGYAGAVPTFNQANYGNGTVYGAFLIRKEAADFRDIPAADLGNPATVEDRLRAVHNWAVAHGYTAASYKC